MSFATIRSTAYSALMTTQVQMQVAASNIANADTEGYTRKVASQVATVYGGVGAGTAVTAITGNVDVYLLKDIISAASEYGAAQTAESYADRLQQLLGSTSGDGDTGASIANSLAALESALSSLVGTPESDTLKVQAVNALSTVVSQLRETSASIQGLRGDADETIEDTVSTVNAALHEIDDLNAAIKQAAGRGQSTADLEDKRKTALQTVSSVMDLSYYTTSNGELRVYTASGTPLVDSQVHELSYSAAALATSATVFSAITVGGKDITSEIKSGTLGALIELRDETLPAAQSAFDELATSLIDAVNAAYNTLTSVTPLSEMSGTVTISAAQPVSASGSLTVALTDADGIVTSTATLDLSSYSTVGDLIDALSAIDGVTAEIDADGHLAISSENGSGLAFSGPGVQIDAAGQGFSDYFGLNDLLTGNSASNIAIRGDILASPASLATGAVSSALSVGSAAAYESGEAVQSLLNVLTADTAFDAAGGLGATTADFASYAASIVGKIAIDADNAGTRLDSKETVYQALVDTMSSKTGVNLDEETARLSELEQYYSAAAQLLETLNSMFEALLAAANS